MKSRTFPRKRREESQGWKIRNTYERGVIPASPASNSSGFQRETESRRHLLVSLAVQRLGGGQRGAPVKLHVI